MRINGLALPLYRKMGKTMTNSRNLALNMGGTGENGAQFLRPILPTPAGAENLPEMVRRSAPALRTGRHRTAQNRRKKAPRALGGKCQKGRRKARMDAVARLTSYSPSPLAISRICCDVRMLQNFCPHMLQ